jgi:hypothetical protein
MPIQPYLFFEGRCEEAIEFYQKALGAKVEMLMRYKDSPEPPPPGMLPPGSEDKVMHAALSVGDASFMASDGHCQGRPGLLAHADGEGRGGGEAAVRRARRRRRGAHAARQDLFLALFRHAGRPLWPGLDDHRTGLRRASWETPSCTGS